MDMEQRIPNHAPFFARSYCFAPKFWLTKVVSAILKQVTGRNTNPSILEYEPQPAIAIFPNALIFDCTNTFARAITEFWKPEGTPFWMIWLKLGPSKRILPTCSWYSSFVRIKWIIQRIALVNWEIAVARAADPTPLPRPAIKNISSTTLMQEEQIR